jgi:hypothetical protein
MTMMLVAMFAAVGLGMFAKNFGRRETWFSVAIAVGLTLIYLLRPSSMT